MLRLVRKRLDTLGVQVRRTSSFEGIDPYVDLLKVLAPRAGDVAFDVGANCGQTVAAMRREFADLPIHGFEPVEASYREAIDHCARFRHVELVHAAVGEQPGRVTIYSHGASQLASLRDTAQTEGSVANTVDVITLDDHARERHIDSVYLLKTDTEGFDLGVLQGARRLFTEGRVAAVLCEVGFARSDRSHTYLPDVIELLEGHGFAMAAMYEIAGFWHLRRWGYTFGNALFLRKDLVLRPIATPCTP